MSNNIFDFIEENNFYDLADSDRWQGFRLLKKDNTAEHTHYVTLFTLLICRALGFDQEKTLKAVQLAILHDFDETYSGDVRHPFKYNPFNGSEVRRAIDEYCKHKIDSLPLNTFTNVLKEIQILSSKDHLKLVVKLADWMSMYFWLEREEQSGNKTVITHLNYCSEAIKELGLKFEVAFGEDNKISADIKELLKQNKTWR